MLEDSPVHSPEHSPSQGDPGAWKDEGTGMPFLEFDLGLPLGLAPEVDYFLQEPASSVRERSGSDSSPEPPAEEYERWVTWWGQALAMPEWWQALEEIPEVDNYWELAQMIWASFELPQWVNKLHDVENY